MQRMVWIKEVEENLKGLICQRFGGRSVCMDWCSTPESYHHNSQFRQEARQTHRGLLQALTGVFSANLQEERLKEKDAFPPRREVGNNLLAGDGERKEKARSLLQCRGKTKRK